MSTPINGQLLSNQSVPIRKTHGDLSQEVITITVDKLSLLLNIHVRSMEQRRSWIAPFTSLITIIVIFATSTFKDFVFKASTWEAFFLMACVMNVIWLVISLISAACAKSVGDLVKIIKGEV